MKSSKIFLDTNVLIYHTFKLFDKQKHEKTLELFKYIEHNFTDIYISSQIIREFYAISTNPKFFDIPLTIDEALLKIDEFQKSFNILSENNLEPLKSLIKEYKITKQNIHDTNIVATMLSNDISLLATFNIKDFKKFDKINLYKF